MTDMHIKVSGVWKALEGLHVKVSGTWKEVQTGYVKVSGAWKEFYASIQLIFAGTASNSATNTGANATASFKFDTDGLVYTRDNGGAWGAVGSWTNRPGDPTDVEIRYTSATGDTGSLTATASEDAWIIVTSTDFIITITDTTPGVPDKSASFTMEIRNSADVTQDTRSYSLTADREDA